MGRGNDSGSGRGSDRGGGGRSCEPEYLEGLLMAGWQTSLHGGREGIKLFELSKHARCEEVRQAPLINSVNGCRGGYWG